MKKRLDPESEAAMEVVAMSQKHEDLQKLQLKKRETAIAQVFLMAGRIEANQFMESQANFMKLVMMKQVKENKEYRDEFGMTWQQFCDMVGVKRRTIDENLEDIEPFKVEFLAAFRQFSGFDFHKIKYLGSAISAGAAKIDGMTISYKGQQVAINATDAEDLQALLDQIQDDLKTRAEEAEANLKAAKRGLRDKDALLEKKNKEIDRYAGKARSQDLTPEEDGFLARMEQARIGFDGYMLGAEPTRMDALTSAPGEESHVTPRMRAAYIELLGYMKRQIIAAHDTAVEMFGADLEEGRL